jgi:hypothetical protein
MGSAGYAGNDLTISDLGFRISDLSKFVIDPGNATEIENGSPDFGDPFFF